MSKLTIIIGGFLIVSIAFNVILLFGKGIQITNNYHQEQYQNQQQAQIVVGSFLTKGNLKWKTVTLKEIEELKFNSFAEYLNSLSPDQSLWAKKENFSITIPEFVEPDYKVKK